MTSTEKATVGLIFVRFPLDAARTAVRGKHFAHWPGIPLPHNSRVDAFQERRSRTSASCG